MLINAETTIQRKHATSAFQGKVSQKLDIWNEQILTILAFCEADLDFGTGSGMDTQITDDIIQTRVKPMVDGLLGEVEKVIYKSETIGRRLNSGVKVCITGEPNVGKSSLMNLLAEENVAIVTDIAGTTRDVLQIPLEIGGFPVILYDTAGVREGSEDIIEKIGIEKTKIMVEEADIVVTMFSPENVENITKHRKQVYVPKNNEIVVLNKIETLDSTENGRIGFIAKDFIKISCSTKTGTDELTKILTTKIASCFEDVSDNSNELILTERRQISHLKEIVRLVDNFYNYMDVDRTIATEQIRLISNELGFITGRTHSMDDILNTIFSNFCIGK